MVDHLLSVGSENLEQTCTFNFLQPSPSRNPNTILQQGSMVVIRDFQDHDENFVFPQANHENLHICSNSHQFEHIPESPSSLSTSCSSSSSTFSPSQTDIWGLPSPPPSDSLVRKNSYFTGWMGNGLEVLLSKMKNCHGYPIPKLFCQQSGALFDWTHSFCGPDVMVDVHPGLALAEAKAETDARRKSDGRYQTER